MTVDYNKTCPEKRHNLRIAQLLPNRVYGVVDDCQGRSDVFKYGDVVYTQELLYNTEFNIVVITPNNDVIPVKEHVTSVRFDELGTIENINTEVYYS